MTPAATIIIPLKRQQDWWLERMRTLGRKPERPVRNAGGMRGRRTGVECGSSPMHCR